MSQTSDTEIEFEGSGGDDLEVVQLERGQDAPGPEEKPEGVTLTKEQYEELVKGKDSTSALLQGFNQFGESLRKQPQPQPVNVPQMPGYNPDEIEEEAFKPKGFVSAVDKVVQQKLAQMQGMMAQTTSQQSRKLMELDPATKENYSIYKKDIEERVASLPPQYRMMPDIYERVYREIIVEKQDEIVERRASKIAEDAVAKALAEAGIGQKKQGNSQTAMYQEGQTRSLQPKQGPKKVYITQSDVQEMFERGMDPKDKDQVMSFVENVKNRRGR